MKDGRFSRKKAYPGSTHNQVVWIDGPTDSALTKNVDQILAGIRRGYQPVIHEGEKGTVLVAPVVPMPELEPERIVA